MEKRTNPYIAGAPVTDQRMFFGREDVFSWIEQNIGGKFSDNMLVVHGQRRVGKTSVLKQLGNRLPDNYIPVFFDFQGRTNTTINKFLYRLAREITRTIEREHGLDCPRVQKEGFDNDSEFFAGEYLSEIKEVLGDKNLVLVFDEFDTLEERTARDMLGQYLVPYFSRMMHGAEHLNFIFSIGSSGHKLEDMRAEYTDFFRLALYKRISFLDAENAKRLIVEPVTGILAYDDDAVDRIVELTSGHPYFTQLICHELFAKAQRTDDWIIDLEDIREVLPDVIERGTVNLKFVWDVANGPERYVMAALADLGRKGTKEEILGLLVENKVRISPEEVGSALLELVSLDVLAQDHDFTVGLMRLWLLENRPLNRVIEELAEKHPVAIRFTQIGDEYREQGQVEGALENYQSALKQVPEYLPALLASAHIYQESDRWLEAVENYQKVIENEPDHEEANQGLCETLIALGDSARESGDIKGAVEHYQKILDNNENYTEARERLASLYLDQAKEHSSQRKWGKAGEALLESWKYIPGSTGERLEQIESLDGLEKAILPLSSALSSMRAELAQEQLKKAVELREGNRFGAALLSLEQALAYQPGLQEVEQEIKRTREIERDLGSDKMIAAGKQSLRSQRWGEAIMLFQRVLDLDLDDDILEQEVRSWIEEARLQEELAERYAAARQALERGVPGRALNMFREILDLEDEYRDVASLVAEARSSRFRKLFPRLVLGIIGVGAVVAAGWYIFRPNVASPEVSEIPATQKMVVIEATLEPTLIPTPIPTAVPVVWQRMTSAQFIARDFVLAIAIDPSDTEVIYAAMESAGIYKSIDGGLSWRPSFQGVEQTRIISLIISFDDPSILFAVSESGIYKTSNGGQTWKIIFNGNVLVMDPQDSNHLYGRGDVDGRGLMISESLDGGDSWESIQDSQCPNVIRYLVVHPENSENLFAVDSGFDGVCDPGVYRSNDGGITWEITGLHIEGLHRLRIDSQKGEYLYASNLYNGGVGEVFKSEDGGLTWSQIWPTSGYTGSPGTACQDIAIDPNDGAIVYCREYRRVLKTTDAGQTWKVLTDLEYPQNAENTLLVSLHDPDTIYLGNRGLYLSVDGGRNWTDRSGGLGATPVDLWLNSDKQSSMYAEESCGTSACRLYLSIDGGHTWELLAEKGNGLAINASGDTLYRGEQDNLVQLKDSDQRWDRMNVLDYGLEGWNYEHYFVSAHPFQDNIIYFMVTSASQPAIYRSSDGGDSWQLTDGKWAEYPSWTPSMNPYLSFDYDRGDVVYLAGGSVDNIIRSSDGGQSWESCGGDNAGLWLSPRYTRLAVDTIDSDRLFAAARDLVIVSDDGCQTWKSASDGLSNSNVNSIGIDPQNTNIIYAGTNNGAYVSFNSGDLWQPINDGLLGGRVIYSIVVDSASNVFAATPLGIFTLESQ